MEERSRPPEAVSAVSGFWAALCCWRFHAVLSAKWAAVSPWRGARLQSTSENTAQRFLDPLQSTSHNHPNAGSSRNVGLEKDGAHLCVITLRMES